MLRWSEVVEQSRGGFVGMVRGGRTVSGVGGGEVIGPGNGKEGLGGEVHGHGSYVFKNKIVRFSLMVMPTKGGG